MTRYLEPDYDAMRDFLRDARAGSVVMLNLLRFRAQADYSAHPELAPPAPVTGAEAFRRYVAHTLPLLRASGGSLRFLGKAGAFLIGPRERKWHAAMLVEQAGIETFLAFASNAEYLAGLGHRQAAIEDSRLLPLTEIPYEDPAGPAVF